VSGLPRRAEELPGHEDLPVARGYGLALRSAAGAVVLAALLVLARAFSLDERARALLEASRGAGAEGVLVHLAAYVALAVLGLPVAPLTVIAGATWGALAGAALGTPGATLGGCAAFLVARLIARDPSALARGEGRLARWSRAIGRGGLRLVLLLRLAPVVPFSLLNFAFGATPTRLSHFALGSLVGTIPSQLGYACLGAVLSWPPGPARTRAEIALVAGAALLSLVASARVVALVRRERAGAAGTRG
jgi:uncharacterized membrane protein YdjX (TVP38/TMEM64 family)